MMDNILRLKTIKNYRNICQSADLYIELKNFALMVRVGSIIRQLGPNFPFFPLYPFFLIPLLGFQIIIIFVKSLQAQNTDLPIYTCISIHTNIKAISKLKKSAIPFLLPQEM